MPKLNFSAGHNAWLGEYQKMLSTDVYRNVISDIFEKPKYFHLGMDEETMDAQERYGYSVVRAKPLWWRDFYHMVDACEKENARPWIWSGCLGFDQVPCTSTCSCEGITGHDHERAIIGESQFDRRLYDRTVGENSSGAVLLPYE